MKLCLRCNQYFENDVEKCPTDQSLLESVGKDPLIGALIDDRYLVDSVIGKGSSGIVYRANRLGRGEMVVAIKVLHSFVGAAGPALDRFLREAQAASQLRNPHIITILQSGVTEDGQPYFVMDYLEGLTLGHLIRDKGQIEPARVLPILRQTCEALAEAHKQGIVHRDLKPENIILQETDHGHDYVKLLDFGIADSPQHSQLSFKLEKPRTVSGSPAYMSPEQCQGFELDARSDIYSLAIVVFEMLTGVRPFRQIENVNVMVLHINEAPLTLSAVRPDLTFPAPVENVIARALSKQPSERQATIQEFFLDLEQAWQFFNLQETETRRTTAPSPFAKLQQSVKFNVTNNETTKPDEKGQDKAIVVPPLLSEEQAEQIALLAKSFPQNMPQNVPAAPIDTGDMEAARNESGRGGPNNTYTRLNKEEAITGINSTVERLIQAAKKGQTTQNSPLIESAKYVSHRVPSSGLGMNAALSHQTLNGQASSSNAGAPSASLLSQETSENASVEGEGGATKGTVSNQETVNASSTDANPEEAREVYISQRTRTTLSRIEGWQKVKRPPAALVTTRARAAALKAETVRRPINLWYVSLTVIVLLILGVCFYIIYSALTIKIPEPTSITELLQTGDYQQVKAMLEGKRLSVPLSSKEMQELSLAYLNLAKAYLARHQTDRALLLLAKIDPQSDSAAEAKSLRNGLLKLGRIGDGKKLSAARQTK